MRKVLFVLVALTIMSGAAEARLLGTITKNQKMDTIWEVMKSAGCNMGWYSKVLTDTKIDPKAVRGLKSGQKVMLEEPSCKTTPPQEVASLSATLLRTDSQAVELAELRRENSRLQSAEESATAYAKEKKSLSDQVDVWKDRYAGLERTKNAEIKNLSAQLGRRVSPWIVTLVALAASALGFAIAYIWTMRRDRQMVKFEKEITVTVDGTSYTFPLVNIEVEEKVKGHKRYIPIHSCPNCGQPRLRGNPAGLRNHILNCPKVERVIVTMSPRLEQKLSTVRH